ncbi:hypothetical protein [Nocardioides sp.]|uniref:hypothetical protein n=1 Tax=Nocardioides sp. TaxID=35761 RepID=UPI002B64C413|nr:hypothetical protein [Nocardioides sp.]HXH79537.1 hypothetical protein [Nocardioides sp.]
MDIIDRIGRTRVEIMVGYFVAAFPTTLAVLAAVWLAAALVAGSVVIVGWIGGLG